MQKDEKKFFWGAATSAHQVEGGNTNDWSLWEKKHAAALAKKASTREWPEHLLHAYPSPLEEQNYISGRACDHYHRYEEDFDIAKSLGHNAHRLSIEWSRIEPEEGKFNEKEIEHYRQVIKALRARGMEPFVTLWHWTNPLWVAKRGGWERKETVRAFLKYVERVTREYKDLVQFWMPLNEPGTFVGMSYIQGAFPPQKRLAFFTANRVFKNLMRAHRETYSVIHQIAPEARVGISHYAVYMMPYEDTLLNRWLVRTLDYIRNWRFLDSVDDANDFIGIQFYHTDRIKFSPLFNGRWGFIDVKNENTRVTDMGWDVYPEGMYYLIKRAAQYKKPIYVTENGIADAKDIMRTQFIHDHLSWMQKGIVEGVDVRGYFYWSLLDNFEWDKGFWPRFGLVEVDYHTLERRVRKSAWDFKKIIEGESGT
ncbi:MAG: hypothetical protein A3C84_05230 [Candidatus Ryanbacteria bacterium RIFCSPHIGHO2_02_FULL_48_12]|uniref:Beta-glucosidase n=1 Tax=Candidatus Ryanbacteria bacterium RIFCSPHIGHO2_01_FULL_48_27 TaxID=1802115 RepID=A0A1G2G8B4_9BACT|nr:MAG: hypothetical protein A2756_05895 [Candidatus Ryanbacteria bacterium RIFCSPHIGHO2_01_FULL_48_27]OGZ49567.1 MAG: hypothetical protein A3C84_05230 [Candidatus Ryanbacteria bacterium RIFCSPHIGHO2_02_FULL_48_12]